MPDAPNSFPMDPPPGFRFEITVQNMGEHHGWEAWTTIADQSFTGWGVCPTAAVSHLTNQIDAFAKRRAH